MRMHVRPKREGIETLFGFAEPGDRLFESFSIDPSFANADKPNPNSEFRPFHRTGANRVYLFPYFGT